LSPSLVEISKYATNACAAGEFFYLSVRPCDLKLVYYLENDVNISNFVPPGAASLLLSYFNYHRIAFRLCSLESHLELI